MTTALVALGGAIGAVLRFVADGEVKRRRAASWPLGTFLINVVGSFVLGALLGARLPSWSTALLATGICGGFTTFSTASVEAVTLLRGRRTAAALCYATGTLLACWGACLVGDLLAA